MRPTIVMLLVLVAFCAGVAWATPAQIVLIRHGEKTHGSPHLSRAGWERARRLPRLLNRTALMRFGEPVALYAAAPKHRGSSVRSMETLEYLATELHLPIIADYPKKRFADMVDEIMNTPAYDGRTVLICWEHKLLSDIVALLGVRVDAEYPRGVFDRIWVVDMMQQPPTLQEMPEHLLAEDERIVHQRFIDNFDD